MLKNKLKSIRAIFFDVDDVLIKGRNQDGQYYWIENLESDLGIRPTEIHKLFNSGWHDILLGKMDVVNRINQFLKEINSTVTTEEFHAYWLKKDCIIDQQVIDRAKQLKNNDYQLYIATNQEQYRAEYLWETVELKNIFRNIFASSSVGKMKPDPEYFKLLQKKVGLAPNEILFLDDYSENVKSANSIGWCAYQHEDYQKTNNDIFTHLLA